MKFITKIFPSLTLFTLITLLLLACTLNPVTHIVEAECSCLNGGTCNENTDECDCLEGWRGTDCSEREVQVDPCDSITCENGGVCVDGQCECTEGWTGNDCSEQVVTMTTISPAPLNLCPTQISGANANFYANGPLYANIVFELEQTATNNPPIGRAETNTLIYTAPAGKQIAEIMGSLSCTTEYTDTDYFMDVLEPEDCTMIDRFEVYGDTSGIDFGDCDAANDSQLTVHFNFIEIGLTNE